MKKYLLFLLLIPVFSACTAQHTDGYLFSSATTVYYLQFTEQQQIMTGQLLGVTQTTPLDLSFTGVHVNEKVTLTFTAYLFFQKTVTGTFENDTITLAFPQSDGTLTPVAFVASTNTAYNQAVRTVEVHMQQTQVTRNNAQATTVAVQATQTAMQLEEQAVATANQKVGNDLAQLQQDTKVTLSEDETLSAFARDWQSMQQDYGIEQRDITQGCAQVNSDVAQVNSDQAQMNSDDAQFSSDQSQYASDTQPIEQDITALQDDWQTLLQIATQNTSGAYTGKQISTAIAQGKSVLQTLQITMTTAQQQITQYDQESTALQTQATQFATAQGC